MRGNSASTSVKQFKWLSTKNKYKNIQKLPKKVKYKKKVKCKNATQRGDCGSDENILTS